MRWILAKTLDHACVPSRLSPFYYLSSSLSSGLATHCSFLSRIHPLSMPWERSCDGFWLKVGLCMCSVSIVSFYYLSLSLIRLSSSRQLFSAFDSVSAFSISLPCFQFIALASIILHRSRSHRLRFQSRFFTSFRSRHPNNMSPIVTFLVSGLPLFIRRYVALILFLSRRRGVAFSGVPSHVPRTIHGLLFFCP